MYFFQLIRWKNLSIILLVQLFAFVFLRQEECFNTNFSLWFALIVLATLLLAAAGYLINDYFDIKIDVVNKPDRIIVSRYISRRWVLILHSFFNLAGVLAAAYVNIYFGLLSIGISLLLWQYTVKLKYLFLIGNLCISLLLALSLLVVLFVYVPMLPDWLSFYAFFAFLTGLIREIIKDIEDMEGDAQYDCKTLPNVLGIYKTKVVLYYLLLATLSLLIFACTYLFYKQYVLLPLYLVLAVAAPLIVLIYKMAQADAKKDFSRLSTWIKLLMLAGILSMPLRCFL